MSIITVQMRHNGSKIEIKVVPYNNNNNNSAEIQYRRLQHTHCKTAGVTVEDTNQREAQVTHTRRRT
jgi:hypothetical protein